MSPMTWRMKGIDLRHDRLGHRMYKLLAVPAAASPGHQLFNPWNIGWKIDFR